MDYQIVHAIEGRIRIRIPLLAEDTGYQSKLQSLIESLKFVTDVRINPMAESMIVTYKFKAISCENMQAHLQQAIEQAAPEPPPPPPPPPEAAPEPAVVKEKSPEVTKEVVQEVVIYTGEQVNLEEDPWEDKTTKDVELPSTEIQQDLPAQLISLDDNKVKGEVTR
ncbi:MAG: HMA2 domain-containing protein [Heteroscytonema crispum UTEX LB 1556]